MKKLSIICFVLGSFFAFTGCNAQQKTPDYSKSQLVDVRTPEEFADGSVKGAINIPVDEIEKRLADFSHDLQIVVFCRSGTRSGRAKSILNNNGFDNVTNGGTWQQVNTIVNSSKQK